jgi:integral membrane sensor domain MASE1
LRSSGIPVAELRAAVIIGSGSASFEMLRYLTERLPAMITPRWVRTKTQPIAIRDVLRYLVRAADLPPEISRAFDGSWLVPVVGWFLLPYSTLAYVLVHWWTGDVAGFDWLFVGLAFVMDLGSYVGSWSRRQDVSTYSRANP